MSAVVVIAPEELRSLINQAVASALDAHRSKLESRTTRVPLHRAARIVKVRDEVIRTAADTGALPSVRRGRARWVSLADLESWAASAARSA